MGQYNQFICPLCGKFNSIRKYDPSDYVIDILAVATKGEGRGGGTSVVDKKSIFSLGMEDLAEIISDRIFDLCSLFFEAEDEEERKKEEEQEELVDELLQDINVEICRQHPKGFNTLFEASAALLRVHRRHKVDEEDEEDDKEEDYIEDGEMYDPAADSQREEDYSEMSELDRELLRAEKDLAFEDTPL